MCMLLVTAVLCAWQGASQQGLHNVIGVQVPVAQREKLLIRGGVNPKDLTNLRLVYQEPQVRAQCIWSSSWTTRT